MFVILNLSKCLCLEILLAVYKETLYFWGEIMNVSIFDIALG